MEPINSPTPGRTPERPVQPLRPRTFVSDFGPRPMARPLTPATPAQSPASTAPAQPIPHPAFTPPVLDVRAQSPAQSPKNPAAAAPATPPSTPSPHPTTNTTPTHAQSSEASAPNPPKEPREKNHNGHAGLIGFGVFVLLGALLLSPLIPGKILDNFPASSQSFVSGSNLPCIDTPQHITTTRQFTTKLGSPIVYSYATTSQQHATCDGAPVTADAGTSGQFNPLGLAIDIVLALVVAIGIGSLWGWLHRRRHTRTQRR